MTCVCACGRPKRYKYTQRWHENAQKLEEGASSETTFWAKVEDQKRKTYELTKDQVLSLEKEEVNLPLWNEKHGYVTTTLFRRLLLLCRNVGLVQTEDSSYHN